jgi:hypothetical protein
MAKIQAKQVKKILTGPIKITGVSVSSSTSSTDITTPITSALTVAGDGSTSVPLQVSTSTSVAGVVTSSPINVCQVWDNTSKEKITYNEFEVYGKLTQSSGVYTISYYYFDLSGTENAYTFTAGASIDVDFNYRFEFHQAPADIIVSQLTRNVSQDGQGAGSINRLEVVSVTSLNSISSLSTTPSDTAKVKLYINGKVEDGLGGSPAFTISGGVNVTWNSGNAGYSVDTSDRVVAEFPI